MYRRTLSPFLLIFLSALAAGACGGGQTPPAEEGPPEITLEKIREDINGHHVSVPAEGNTSEPSGWRFFPNEPKEIEILEKQVEGNRATFVINLRTRTSPRSEQKGITKSLAGNLRLHYELQTGLVLRRWEIMKIENISFAYQKE